MSVVVGYKSALEYWRTVGPQWLRSYDERRTASKRARRVASSQESPELVGGSRRPAGCTLPVHVVVSNAKARSRTVSVQAHVCEEIPLGSVVDAGMGFFVSTPEFCFLQMARMCSLAQLIMLGYELCGTYSLARQAPARVRDEPLTSVKKLAAFVEAHPGRHGCKKARRALLYVQDGSASPMETACAMLLCLPYKMGGYNLDKPQMNYVISVSGAMRRVSDRSYCKADLCWPDHMLCVEYDSELYHASKGRRESDARRRGTLTALGYTVMTVTFDQLADGAACNRLAHQVAKATNKRLRYKDPEFTRAHIALRTEIFESLAINSREKTD